jgi:hypothetical protein
LRRASFIDVIGARTPQRNEVRGFRKLSQSLISSGGSAYGGGKRTSKGVGQYFRRNSTARHHASKSLDGLAGRGVEAAVAGLRTRRDVFARPHLILGAQARRDAFTL